MRQKRLISASVAALFLAGALVGCSEAKDAADKGKEKGSEMASEGLSKGADEASDALSDATDGGSDGAADGGGSAGATDGATDGGSAGATGGGAEGAEGAGGVTVDLGEFADDPNAKTAGQFFQARQAAVVANDGDLAALEAITTPDQLETVTSYVQANGGKAGAYAVTVVGVEGSSVDACVGPDGTLARTLTLEDGKVALNAAGDHTC